MVPRWSRNDLIDFSQFVSPLEQTGAHSVQGYPCMNWKIFIPCSRRRKNPLKEQHRGFRRPFFQS
jgi:hypothetical protein